jgi:hypothetical protein
MVTSTDPRAFPAPASQDPWPWQSLVQTLDIYPLCIHTTEDDQDATVTLCESAGSSCRSCARCYNFWRASQVLVQEGRRSSGASGKENTRWYLKQLNNMLAS